MELTTAALAAKLCGVEADDELLGVLCAAAEQAWKNRLQSGVTPADCGSALPCAAAFTAAADYLGKRSRVESMTVGEVTVRGLSAAFANPKLAAEPIAFGKTQKALFVSPGPDTASKRAKGIYEIP